MLTTAPRGTKDILPRDVEAWRYLERRGGCAEALAAMRGASHYTRGRLSREAVHTLYGRSITLSASRMDKARSCHFAYFMQYGLRAKDRRPAGFEAPEIGTFIHYLLENVTRDVLGQGGFAAVDNKELHRLTRQYIDQYAEQELHNFQNRTVGLIENGTWAPTAAKQVKEKISEMKDMTILDIGLTIKSAMHADQKAELDALADAIVNSMV